MTTTAVKNELMEMAHKQAELIPRAPPQIVVSEPMTPMALMYEAVQKGASPEIIEKLMNLQERWEQNQNRKAFDRAIAAAKAEMPVIFKSREAAFDTKSGSRKSYRFEDFATIAKVVDPILSKHGLCARFRPSSDEKSVTVTCILSHKDGHREEYPLTSPHDPSGNKNPIQALGSASSYLQRYTLKLALGLAASADDDGHAAFSNKAEPQISGELISDEQIKKITDALTFKNRTSAELLDWLRKSIPDIGGIDELPVEYYDSCIAKIGSLKPKA